jgi:hypothetical protein
MRNNLNKKGKKIKRIRTKLKIIIHNKLKLNDEIENKKYFYKRVKEKK